MNRILHSYVAHRLEIIVKEGFWIWGTLSYVSLSFVCAVADYVRTKDIQSSGRRIKLPKS